MSTKEVWKRLLGFLWQFKGLLLISFICAAISVWLNVLAPLLIGNIIDRITALHDIRSILKDVALLVAVYGFYSVFNWGMMYASNKIAFSCSCVLRKQLYEKIERLPISFYDKNAKGDLISRFVNDVDFISDGFLQGLSTILSGGVTIVLSLYFMLRVNWIMALIVVVSAPFTYLVAKFITSRSQKYFAVQANALGAMNGYGEEQISGIRTVKAYGHEKQSLEQFKKYNQELYTSGVKSQFYGSLANPSTRFVMNTAYTVVGVTGAALALMSMITIGNISSFLIYSNLFSKPFTEISGVMTQLQNAVSSGRRIFTIMDMTEESRDEHAPVLQAAEGRIDFEHIGFEYEEGKPLMKDIDLHIKGGSRIAVVGRTGAGKTTLVNLLMRFYDIKSGRILIDGQDIMKVSRDSLRQNFGMVLQDTYLFDGTIAENIAYGRPDASREEIIEAARKSGAHEFILRLGKGYDTVLHANSNSLSQGQRQLLSITRVLLMNPRMLILDEATSSIDTVSEQNVNRAMDLLMKGKTSFIIAHRLSTIVDADMILVMDHGNIIEKGTHKELLEKGGYYTQLFNSQFA